METKLTLRDGTNILIRNLEYEDLDSLMEFYRTLPEEDRRFLKIDVTKKNVVEKRLELMKSGQVLRFAAFNDEDKSLIADGALELPAEGWRVNQAEVRVIVAKPFQRMGLGMLMMRELIQMAREHNVEDIVVKMMQPQLAAKRMCQKLGFRKKTVIPNYVVDVMGEYHNLLIMTRKVKDIWQDLNNLYYDTDWRRCR
jgi:L-amino acid N-acyltransferase YncA